ncbi:15697_t:CDS:2 [Acaulospora colombiana]|uniref:15697_t:CDS:1 n=1 Tax=Acaulospora colombiana TaxID=27376 RepID=A0ACA9LL76_9GLOM|nr:15697_t:CDS:2 [Acaulospora colombiana]
MPPKKAKQTAEKESSPPPVRRSSRQRTVKKEIIEEDSDLLAEEEPETKKVHKKRAKNTGSSRSSRVKKSRPDVSTDVTPINNDPHTNTLVMEQRGQGSEMEEIMEENVKNEDIVKEDASLSPQIINGDKINSEAGSSTSNRSKNDNTEVTQAEDVDPNVQKRWESIKERLFETPKLPKPPYKDYQDKLLVKRPWMKKRDIDYLHKLLTDPNSELGYKVIKHIINYTVYSNFTDEQKARLLNLLPSSELVPIASDAGEPIDTPRIERERQSKGLKLYEAGITSVITEIDPTKVVPRFDFWLSDAFKDARWWFQLSIRYGYFTKIGVDTQWTNLEKFKTEIPDVWKNDAFEQDWGIGLWGKIGNKQIAGDSAQITLPDLAKALIIKPNDTLKYKRQFKNIGVTVSMDVKVISIDKSNGHLQIKLIKGKQSKTIDNIHNPTRLENELLDFDGQVPRKSRPNGNAFKNFSIQRSAEYTPSLFEARKEYWAKSQ